MAKWNREVIESVYTLETMLTLYDIENINKSDKLLPSQALEDWLMSRKMRIIKCKCGNSEQCDYKSSRRKTKKFTLKEYDDFYNGGIYTCNECGDIVNSANVAYKFTLDSKYDKVVDLMVKAANMEREYE
jgi:hypothetical protein